MAEHIPTSINIKYDRQDDDSTLHSITKSTKSTVVTQNKKDETVLQSGNTTPLQKSPK